VRLLERMVQDPHHEAEGVADDPGGEGKRLTLKDMVRGARTTARAVRFYEEQRLIRTEGRSPGGHRYFTPEELPKLRLVLELRTCGFSIEEIREILEAKSRCGTVREAAQSIQQKLGEHVKELRRKIETIEKLGREFSTSISLLDRCIHCTDPRGAGACSTCDLPMHAPDSFCHIWMTAPPKTE
jgi:DNA-binding transcriptional MerR regulator